MKLLDVIKALQQAQEEHGDLPTYFWNRECDGLEVERVSHEAAVKRPDIHDVRPERIIIDDGIDD